jgi:shikimate kinase
MARPIFLIGFMCSGKSRVGRQLAQQLGLRHVDIDRVVEARVGPLVPYFQQHGEAAFREREREVLLELLQEEDVVVSTGGGTPLEGDNLERMLAAGPVVFLDVPMATLMPRIIRAGGDRPLLLGLKGEALRTRVENLLVERTPVYSRAPHRVDTDGTPEEVACRIRQALG